MILCKHDWNVVSDVVTESTFEMATRVLKRAAIGKVSIPGQLCVDDRKHIVVMACKRCGKVKKIVTEI